MRGALSRCYPVEATNCVMALFDGATHRHMNAGECGHSTTLPHCDGESSQITITNPGILGMSTYSCLRIRIDLCDTQTRTVSNLFVSDPQLTLQREDLRDQHIELC